MSILRLTQSSEKQGNYRVEVALEEDGQSLRTAVAIFGFELTPQDHEDLRWYLEDYLEYHQDPDHNIAKRVEGRMAEIGKNLFITIFNANEAACRLWDILKSQISNTQMEIVTDVTGAIAIPWELIRNPLTDAPLALEARSFVRAPFRRGQMPTHSVKESGPIRILLVISRPGREDDVPYRSVARRIVMELSKEEVAHIQLKVLRPSTFKQLKCELKNASDSGKPYHVVHFDGHGDFTELDEKYQKLLAGPWRPGSHGYLEFEDLLVDGPCLGNLLVETNVSLLVLNACRSAYAELPPQSILEPDSNKSDANSQIAAFGSLAQEIMDVGVPGIVAMRYTVDVTTVSQFVQGFYRSLVMGKTLGEAAKSGRMKLYDQPLREIDYEPLTFRDWAVPVVYGIASLALFPRLEVGNQEIKGTKVAKDTFRRRVIDPQLPVDPDAGFIGRDEIILALDRRFDEQKIVLLQGYAGEGKTSTAADFARWYSQTEDIIGPVLFTSFERYQPLSRVLDKLEHFFREQIKWLGTNWLALSDDQRRDVALQVLRQCAVLWIWDNVEPIAGFPTGSESAWSRGEQQELVEFLKDAQKTQAKFLLTSRRDEGGWLGDLAVGIKIPPMPMRERVEMAISMAERRGRKLTNIEDWIPLLRFTQGNPLTITVIVRQVLREGLKTKDLIEEFVTLLKTGEKEIQDDESLGRSRSLGASLSYGFQHTFNDFERRILALLYFFQGFVNVDVLTCMFDPKKPKHIGNAGRLTCEESIRILDKAADIGLLKLLDEVYYSIHPALPWYFRSIFHQYYRGREDEAVRAFVEAVSSFGEYLSKEYDNGNREVISTLVSEESNLLYAMQLALGKKLWGSAISAITGIRVLYDHTGKLSEWKRLVEELEPFYLDAESYGPISGRQNGWDVVINSKVRLARKARQMDEAQRLLKKYLYWARKHANRYFAERPRNLDRAGKATIWNYVISIKELGHIQREMNNPECIRTYQKADEIMKKFGFKDKTGVLSRNIATAYLQVDEIKDLDAAERLCKKSLSLTDESDFVGRGKSFLTLGQIILERIREMNIMGKRDDSTEQKYLKEAQEYFDRAIETFQEDDVPDLADTHNSLEDFEKLINRNVYILLILYYFVYENTHRFCH